MTNQLNLTPDQITQLNVITNGNTGNYAAAYRFIHEAIKQAPDVDQQTKFWFQKAIEINSNDPGSTANTYIRSVTEFGRRWDGYNAGNTQAATDLIGQTVVADITNAGGIPQFNNLINSDIQPAVNFNNQTAGGWGGSFYYWNAQWSADGRTVGQTILGSPVETEKFITVNARAVFDVLLTHGGTPTVAKIVELIDAGFNAQVPAALKLEIANRLFEAFTVPNVSLAGDPNNITSFSTAGIFGATYTPVLHDDGYTVVGWRHNGNQVSDPDLITDLNAIRAIRLQKANGNVWRSEPNQLQRNSDGTVEGTFDQADGTPITIKVRPGKIDAVEERNPNGSKHKLEFGSDGDPYHARETHTDATGAYTKYVTYLDTVFAGPTGELVRVANEYVVVRDKESGFERRIEIGSVKYVGVQTGETHGGAVTQTKIDGNVVALAQFGTSFGSLLGRTLGNGNVAAEIGLSSILGTLTGAAVKVLAQGAVGPLLGWSTGPMSFEQALGDTFAALPADFAANLAGSVGGALSSLVIAELADALGLGGFEAQVFQSVAGSVTSKFFTNAWTFATNGGTGNLLAGLDLGGIGGSLAGAFGGLLGSMAAGNILAPANATAATFSSFTSMAGSFVATWGMAQIVGVGMAALTSFIPFVGPLIGTFVGQLVGTHAGNLWFDTDDRASAILKVNEATARYHVAQWTHWDGGQTLMAGALADAVIAGMDGLAAATGGVLDTGHATQTAEIGYYVDSRNWMFAFTDAHPDGYFQDIYASPHGKREEALLNVVEVTSQHLSKFAEIKGGDVVMTRAFYATRGSDTTQMSFDLMVAKEYAKYLETPDVINALIAADPNSDLANGWIVILTRAQELGLNQGDFTDFRGGFGFWLQKRGYEGYLDWRPALSSDDRDALTLRSPVYDAQTIVLQQTFAPGATWTFAGGAGGDNVNWHAVGGFASWGYADLGAGSDVLVGHAGVDVIDGGAGDDVLDGWLGQDWLYGGDGNDYLSGGDGDDLLVGGAGNDTLHGGAGNDMMIDGPGGDLMIIGLTDKADVIFKGGQGAAAFTDYIEIHTAATTTSLNFRKVGLDLRIESLAGQTVNAGGVTVENYFLTPGLVDYVSSTVGQYDVGYPMWYQLLNYSLVTETLTRPDGFREYIQLDGGNVHPWSSSRHVYDGSNALHSHSWFMDDGTSGTQSFDTWNFANWSMATTHYDWTGAIATTDMLFDGGSRVVTNHAASTATHTGSAGADFLLGTALNETISGLEGDLAP